MIGWIAWVLIGLTLLVGVALIIVVMMQSSKDGSSAAYAGFSKSPINIHNKITIPNFFFILFMHTQPDLYSV